jgi:Asp-tRNA(Asn)/Glu-tRNA(Gln) amidotransferase A subunit family amidase
MFCGWVNAMSYAGLSVPGRPSADGRPIGIQLVGPLGGDEILFELAHDLQAAAPWKERWPAMAVTA